MATECNQEPFPFHPLNQREYAVSLTAEPLPVTLGVCCCGKWKSGQASSGNSPAALRTIGIRNWWNTGWRSWWRSGFTDWLWATRI